MAGVASGEATRGGRGQWGGDTWRGGHWGGGRTASGGVPRGGVASGFASRSGLANWGATGGGARKEERQNQPPLKDSFNGHGSKTFTFFSMTLFFHRSSCVLFMR